jgi:uncharacterized coiled-coil protein SlyX
MNISIYDQEIKDGLADQLKNNSVVCYAAAQTTDQPSQDDVERAVNTLKNSAIAENKDQIDLFYIKSILVSTGWNKNDDVFDPQETWEARFTPEDKPFNFMHDEKDIIGHITANEVVDFEGNPIASDSQEPPSQFNILTSAVIYTEWSDPEQRQRIQKLLAEIKEGKWFVSMECLFPNFDYALTKGEETKVVKRDQASAFLTKYLRSYGGTGTYEDYKVGRLLRNLSFSGKGLVSKPANPRSVILEGNDFFDESQAQVLSLSSFKENYMSDQDKQIEDLRAELAEAKAANEALKEKVIAEQQAEFESRIQDLESKLSEQAQALQSAQELITEKEEALAKAQEDMKNKDKDMKEKMDELREMKKKEAVMKRKAQLEEAGFDAEEASATVSELENLDDATFETVVAVMKKKAVKKEMMKEEEAVMYDKKKKDAKAEEDEVEVAEASEEVLDSVEAPSEVAIAEAMGEEDPAQNLRAVATEWIGSVLKSNK